MTPIILKSFAAIAATAGLAISSIDGAPFEAAYSDGAITSLTAAQLAGHAAQTFERADRNGDKVLDADEYTSLVVITAELARLNGFISIGDGPAPAIIDLPFAAAGALPRSEHIRIAAVSRNAFYGFAGYDAVMDSGEFSRVQAAQFDAADRNRNGRLGKRELGGFAQRQAGMAIGA